MADAIGTDAGVPELWTQELRVATKENLVVAQNDVVNHDYEGAVQRQGDSVHITGLAAPSIGDYDRVNGYGDPERLNIDDVVLQITQKKKYDFLVDTIEQVQLADKNVIAKAAAEAGFGLAQEADDFAIKTILDGALAANKVSLTGANGLVDASEIYSRALLGGMTKLNKNRVPLQGRYAIVDPEGFTKFLQATGLFVANGSEASDGRLLNGQVGTAAGFKILVSNSPRVAGKMILGVKSAVTFADQINKARVMQSENWDGTRVNGLHVYGALVTRPEQIAVVTWTDKTAS